MPTQLQDDTYEEYEDEVEYLPRRRSEPRTENICNNSEWDRSKYLFGDGTMNAAHDQQIQDETKTKPRWTSGVFPLFDEAISTFQNGLVFLGSAPNAGKTNFLRTLYQGYLDNMPDSIVLDFVLDDTRSTRIRSHIAALGNISVREVTLPKLLPEGSPKLDRRQAGYRDFISRYNNRLALLESDSLDGSAAYIETIVDYATKVRSNMESTAPLFIAIDAFDDLLTERNFQDENKEAKFLSAKLKNLAQSIDAMIFITKHTVKDLHRGAGLKALSGSGKLGFDAIVGGLAYNDVLVNGDAAQIYFNRDDVEDQERKYPIFEVNMDKNKAGDFRSILCYFQFPEKYTCIECTAEQQKEFRQMIHEQVGKPKQRNER